MGSFEPCHFDSLCPSIDKISLVGLRLLEVQELNFGAAVRTSIELVSCQVLLFSRALSTGRVIRSLTPSMSCHGFGFPPLPL